MNKENTVHLSQTNESWDILTQIANEKYPKRPISHFIHQELGKALGFFGGGDGLPCEFSDVGMKKMHYRIPPSMVEQVNCLCIRFKIDPATLIFRLAIEPHILAKIKKPSD